MKIRIDIYKDDEHVSGGTALSFESAEELLGKLERAYE